jgi:hypothetical protein
LGRPDFLRLDPNIQPQFLASVAGKVAGLILAVFPVTIIKKRPEDGDYLLVLGSSESALSRCFAAQVRRDPLLLPGFFGSGFSRYVAEPI